jgi:hypothetical protein
MSLERKPPAKVSIEDEDGLIKQATYSAFSPKSPVKYLNAISPFPSRVPSSNFSPVANSGVQPPVQDLLYVAEGYVENGYV